MNRLVIIDGNAILHRAFHALPPLTAPNGTVVNAVYGFTSMLLRLISDLSPTHIAVAFDRPAPTFRKSLYEKYQIKRPKMDEGLAAQIPIVHSVVKQMKLPVFEQDGFEADDMIGSICQTFGKTMDQIIVVTGDRDLLQLVSDRVRLYMPTKGLSEAKLYGEKETEERMGVEPKQIPDFKALAGDSSDNYPGVPGVGPKTATSLLHQYVSVEKLYASLQSANVPSALKEKLIKNKDLAFLSKELATIKKDIPIEVSIPRIDPAQFTNSQVLDTFTSLGFHSLIKRMRPQEPTKKSVEKKREQRKQAIDEQMSLL